MGLDGEFSELSNESLNLLGVSGIDLLSELLDGLVSLGGNGVGRVGSLNEFTTLQTRVRD